MRYDHRQIEAKWQKHWQEKQAFKCEKDEARPKYYVLDMFPYPSGSGLHVGHVVGYTATDIVARYKRQRGFNVLHPMGWDSFGLAAEQYAIRTGQHPAVTTQENIANFRRQLKALGYSYDWDREIETSKPNYYKWTQWIFTKLYEKGLAYEAEMLVNYCPALGTVLANEEVEEGKSVEGGHAVERRPLRQWVLKITEYADRLLADLDQLDWSDHLKKLQANWIGRSEGTCIRFMLEGNEPIEVFTTRPDTLFGVSYLTLAPEHPLVASLTTDEQRAAVTAYQEHTKSKSDIDRTDLNKEKSGVFLGSFAFHPISQKPLPIWISDYVLMHYGTGAVMAVPAHDERDFEFAKRYELPIQPVIEPLENTLEPIELQEVLSGNRCWTGEGTLIHSDAFTHLSSAEAKKAITAWLEKNEKGKEQVSYKLRDWLFSRQRYWGEPIPIVHFADGSKRALELDELPLCPPELSDFKPTAEGLSPLAKATDWIAVNHDDKTGKAGKREINTMPQWAGSCWYYLRFIDPHNEGEAWSLDQERYWLPVDLYVGGVEHAVLHLLYARFWHKVLYDLKLVHSKEPFQKLRNQGLVVAQSFKTAHGHYISASDVIEKEGSYYHKESKERLLAQVEKMGKSKLNGVSPDEIIEEFGADALRLYEMFMGPLDKEKVWNSAAVNGCRRFLQRFYDVVTSPKVSAESSEEALKLGYRLVAGVTEDLENLQFNTAIAKLMQFLNEFSKLDAYPSVVLQWVAQCLMPFAPHMAEEAWQILGRTDRLLDQPYPQIEERYLQDEQVTYVVQVNGKLRGRFDLPKDQSQEKILQLALANAQIAKYVEGKEVRKVVFVPNKLLNLVV